MDIQLQNCWIYKIILFASVYKYVVETKFDVNQLIENHKCYSNFKENYVQT